MTPGSSVLSLAMGLALNACTEGVKPEGALPDRKPSAIAETSPAAADRPDEAPPTASPPAPPASWGTATLLGLRPNITSSFQVAGDGKSAAILWVGDADAERRLSMRTFFSGQQEQELTVASRFDEDPVDYAVTVGGDCASIIWSQMSNQSEVDDLLLYRRFCNATGWDKAILLDGFPVIHFLQLVTLDPSRVLVVWVGQDDVGGISTLHATEVNGEVTSDTVLASSAQGITNTDIKYQNGLAILTWTALRESDGPHLTLDLDAAIYRNGAWEDPETIGTVYFEGASTSFKDLVFLNDGGAVMVWRTEVKRQDDKRIVNLVSSRYSVASQTWSAPQPVGLANASVEREPSLVRTADGIVHLAWSADIDGNRSNIVYSFFTGGAWQKPTVLNPGQSTDAKQPHLAADLSGNLIAIWTGYDGKLWNIYSKIKIGGAWQEDLLVETKDLDAARPRIVSIRDGLALGVWKTFDVEGIANTESGSHIFFNTLGY